MRTEISQGKERLDIQPFQENIDLHSIESKEISKSERNDIEQQKPANYVEQTAREEIVSTNNLECTRFLSFIGAIICGAYSRIQHFIPNCSENAYFKLVITASILTISIVILFILYCVQEDMHRDPSLQMPKQHSNRSKYLFM
ncbi:hypothetical protein WA026_019675 [Henosepilachna vigintioctopunctata]|uniref:Uncharacterized protein n=1 Tax=Henosepilachna vigintioctopunctata TaxID=420089 RepID=A0AAW1UHM5_9CUCU